jgi:hypothetical protein
VGLREPADEFDLVEGGAAAAALCGCCREEAGASVVAAGLRGIEVTSGGVDQRPGVEQAVPALQGRVQRSLQKGLSNSIWTPHGGPRRQGPELTPRPATHSMACFLADLGPGADEGISTPGPPLTRRNAAAMTRNKGFHTAGAIEGGLEVVQMEPLAGTGALGIRVQKERRAVAESPVRAYIPRLPAVRFSGWA